jgi:hypothetical protein
LWLFYFAFQQSADHLRDLLELCGYSPEATEAILAKTELAETERGEGTYEEVDAPERTASAEWTVALKRKDVKSVDAQKLAASAERTAARSKREDAKLAKGQRPFPNPKNETDQNQTRQEKYEAETKSRSKDEEVKSRAFLPVGAIVYYGITWLIR